jgi:sorbose reductase
MAGVLSLFDLAGHRAVVTGAGQGLGKGMALALAEAGADIAVIDINAETAEQTVGEIRSLGRRALSILGDVSSPEQVRRMSEQATEKLGDIDILVNNAGISAHVDSARMAAFQWQRVLDVNMTGVFLCCQVFAPAMMAKNWGRIINIASMSGLIVNKDVPQAPYYASKAGVIMLTKALAAEWGAHGVTVNAIAPGYMRTPLNEGFLADPARAAQWTSGVPLGRIGSAADLAGAVVFLASSASSYVTGHTLVVDGGFTLW